MVVEALHSGLFNKFDSVVGLAAPTPLQTDIWRIALTSDTWPRSFFWGRRALTGVFVTRSDSQWRRVNTTSSRRLVRPLRRGAKVWHLEPDVRYLEDGGELVRLFFQRPGYKCAASPQSPSIPQINHEQ